MTKTFMGYNTDPCTLLSASNLNKFIVYMYGYYVNITLSHASNTMNTMILLFVLTAGKCAVDIGPRKLLGAVKNIMMTLMGRY